MMHLFEQNLEKLGLTLPEPEAPAASYLNFTLSGKLIFISGQTPLEGFAVKHKGKLGKTISITEGQAAAENCGLQLVALLKAACEGDWNRLSKIVKITAMINAIPTFTEHSLVVNGCSNFLHNVFGEIGRHARFSIGVSSLPGGAPIEIEMIAEFK